MSQLSAFQFESQHLRLASEYLKKKTQMVAECSQPPSDGGFEQIIRRKRYVLDIARRKHVR